MKRRLFGLLVLGAGGLQPTCLFAQRDGDTAADTADDSLTAVVVARPFKELPLEEALGGRSPSMLTIDELKQLNGRAREIGGLEKLRDELAQRIEVLSRDTAAQRAEERKRTQARFDFVGRVCGRALLTDEEVKALTAAGVNPLEYQFASDAQRDQVDTRMRILAALDYTETHLGRLGNGEAKSLAHEIGTARKEADAQYSTAQSDVQQKRRKMSRAVRNALCALVKAREKFRPGGDDTELVQAQKHRTESVNVIRLNAQQANADQQRHKQDKVQAGDRVADARTKVQVTLAALKAARAAQAESESVGSDAPQGAESGSRPEQSSEQRSYEQALEELRTARRELQKVHRSRTSRSAAYSPANANLHETLRRNALRQQHASKQASDLLRAFADAHPEKQTKPAPASRGLFGWGRFFL